MPPIKSPLVAGKMASNYDPINNVGRLLKDTAAELSRSIDQKARAIGISGAQWVVLIRIGDGIGNTAKQLCDTIGYDSGSMTRMLNRLENMGLVCRQPSDDDGRASQLALTAQGWEIHPKLRPMAIAVLEQYLAGFSESETQQLMGFLQRMIENGMHASADLHTKDDSDE